MTTDHTDEATPSMAETFGFHRYRFTLGKAVVLAAALFLVVAGFIGSATGNKSDSIASDGARSGSAGAAESASGRSPGLMNSFAESNRPTSSSEPVRTNEPNEVNGDKDGTLGFGELSPAMVRGGFGMFIGFAIGFAIRAFIRLAVVMIGVYFLLLTLMAYGGWVEIHWSVIEGQFDQLATSFTAQFESFKAFLTGSIPSAGVTGVGLVAGLKQK